MPLGLPPRALLLITLNQRVAHSAVTAVRPVGLRGDFLLGLYRQCDRADFERCGLRDS